jgi:hypothetical protein
MGLAPGSALALGGRPVSLRQADGNDDIRVGLTRLEPALSGAVALAGPSRRVLAPNQALPLTLPAGDKAVQIDLPPGTAAIAGWTSPRPLVAWAGGEPLARMLAGAWTDLLLVNTGPSAAPVALSWQSGPAAPVLRPGVVVRQVFAMPGSFELAGDAAPGTRIGVAGDAGLTLIGADGTVRTGQGPVPVGAGRVVVRHRTGLVAVWMETDAASPWPSVAARPAALPAHLVLDGPAMALGLAQPAPVLLHGATTGPVLIALGGEPPRALAAGAAFHLLVPAGDTVLRAYPPLDGPLTGTMDLATEPVIAMTEGLGDAVSVAPGGAVAFGFALDKAATIGVGVRADPDRATVRLLDSSGRTLGEGVAQLRALPAGNYLIEAEVAPDATATLVRPAVIGITPRGNGPPPDVVAGYLTLAGMKPQGDAK